MDCYPTLSQICDMNPDNFIPDGKEAVVFKDRYGMHVVARAVMADGTPREAINWKVIATIAQWQIPTLIRASYTHEWEILGDAQMVSRRIA